MVLMLCSLKGVHTLLCSTVKAFFEVDDCDPKRLVPLGGSLSELLCREPAWFEACLVSGLVGVNQWGVIACGAG